MCICTCCKLTDSLEQQQQEQQLPPVPLPSNATLHAHLGLSGPHFTALSYNSPCLTPAQVRLVVVACSSTFHHLPQCHLQASAWHMSWHDVLHFPLLLFATVFVSSV